MIGERAPDLPWLSRTFLHDYVALRREDGDILRDDRAVKAALTATDRERFTSLWEARYRRLAELDVVPRTLCHFDFHPLNLFDDEGETAVIDWSFAGLGPVGSDAATLVFDTLLDYHLPAEQAAELFELVATQYIVGLAEVGAPIGADDVRRAMVATAAARYAWTVPAALTSLANGRPTLNGRPMDEGLPVWLGVGAFLLDLTGH